MTVTASVVIASSMFGAQAVDAATHKVKPGDNLWRISQKYNTNVSQLKSWNNLSSNIIYPNQVLEIGDVKTSSKTSNKTSSSSKKESSASKGSSSSSSKVASTYKVKRGDTLSHIAIAHGISLQNLMKWNNLNSTLIYPGDMLNVGEKTSSSANKPSSNTNSSASTNSSSSSNKNNTSATSSSAKTYTVKSGDTLSKIAANHGISLSTLMNTNNLSSHLIYPGDKLKVGKATTSTNKPNNNASSSNNTSANKTESNSNKNNSTSKSTYTIKSGDTLGAIAAKHGVTVNNLKKWNNLSSHIIYPGEKLTINGTAGTNNSQSTANKDSKPSKDTSQTPNVSAPAPSGDLISTAKSAIGVPYVWAGTTTSGFDCSGFIYWAFNKSGESIPRLSTDGYYNRSYMVDKPSVGDLVFFEGTYKSGISHMGIYLGNNEFIQAGSSTGVTISNLDNPYWSKHFHSFKRFY